MLSLIAPLLLFFYSLQTLGNGTFQCTDGNLLFKSEAPLETITANSRKLRGVIDADNQAFAWSVDVKTFDGFGSPLQKEHFNENYMESNKYPLATFKGKIIEKIDFTKIGIYKVRAKGKFSLHGVEQERIVKVTLEVKKDQVVVKSTFIITLSEHDIAIPTIVHQKIAEEISITVNATLQLKNKP
jgi:YceI-like domain